MISFSGPLREARVEVMPRLPELAPQLKGNRHVILDALQTSYSAKGRDPALVPARDWNKTERHTIAGFAIDEQVSFLVEGEGPEARFKDFQTNRKGRRNRRAFIDDLRNTQYMGARHVEQQFKNGQDSEHSWWPRAARRYRGLGMIAVWQTRRYFLETDLIAIPPEGIFLHKGLRTAALVTGIDAHLNLLRNVKNIRNHRLQAAHDLAHLIVGLAGLHAVELHRVSNMRPEVRVYKDAESRRYRAVIIDREQMKSLRHRGAYPNAKLKCPAQVLPQIAPGADAEPSGPLYTNLQTLFHAAINETPAYDVW